jgi:hypothetical protein
VRQFVDGLTIHTAETGMAVVVVKMHLKAGAARCPGPLKRAPNRRRVEGGPYRFIYDVFLVTNGIVFSGKHQELVRGRLRISSEEETHSLARERVGALQVLGQRCEEVAQHAHRYFHRSARRCSCIIWRSRRPLLTCHEKANQLRSSTRTLPFQLRLFGH